MLAIYTVGITSIVMIILAYAIFTLGGKYRKMGTDLFKCTIGMDMIYAFLVLSICAAPSNFWA